MVGQCGTDAPLGRRSSFESAYGRTNYVDVPYSDEESGEYGVGLTSP